MRLRALHSWQLEKTSRSFSEISEQSHLIFGDRLSLSEVFVNIIGNSIKYSPDGTRVTLKADLQGNYLVVSIKDDGIGISQEDLPHIFDGFYRGKSGQAMTGHGIGLAVARQIVDAHDGSISVESELGKGTTFLISLPISNA